MLVLPMAGVRQAVGECSEPNNDALNDVAGSPSGPVLQVVTWRPEAVVTWGAMRKPGLVILGDTIVWTAAKGGVHTFRGRAAAPWQAGPQTHTQHSKGGVVPGPK